MLEQIGMAKDPLGLAGRKTSEVAVVRNQTAKALAVAHALVIQNEKDMVKATDVLANIKRIGKELKDYKEMQTRPFMDALDEIRDTLKPLEQNRDEAERTIKNKMLAYQQEQQRLNDEAKAKLEARVEKGTMKQETAVAKIEEMGEVKTTTQGKVGAVATRTIKRYRVVDETLLPREYLVPNIAKITEDLRAGKEVAGAEMYTEQVIASSYQLDASHPLLGQK